MNTPSSNLVRTARNRARVRSWLVGSAVLAGLAAGAYWYSDLYPKRFAAVEPGRLYRSGGVTPDQLERLVQREGIRRVLSLLNPEAPESIAERAAAERLGLEWINIPMRGDGSSTPADRDALRRILLEPHDEPLLVHCAAGANRTGLAIGMYRLHHDGWSVEQVMEEMRRFGFEDQAHHENLRAALRKEAQLAQKSRLAAQSGSAGR